MRCCRVASILMHGAQNTKYRNILAQKFLLGKKGLKRVKPKDPISNGLTHPQFQYPIPATRCHFLTIWTPIHGKNLSEHKKLTELCCQESESISGEKLECWYVFSVLTSSAWPGRSCFSFCVLISHIYLNNCRKKHVRKWKE